jgi:hypothetical protein
MRNWKGSSEVAFQLRGFHLGNDSRPSLLLYESRDRLFSLRRLK